MRGKKRIRTGGETEIVGYLRVSTAEQADSGAGLAAQRQTIQFEADRRGWVVVHWCTDAGTSGKSIAGRPALAEALELVEGDRASAIVVAKLDRLSRSLLDFAELLARARANSWNLVALDLGVDLATPAGEFLAGVMASAAQWERRIIGQRTREALAARKAAGTRLGRPPVLPNAVVERLVECRERGQTFAVIAAELNEDRIPTAHGDQKWHPSTVRAVVQSRQR